ncbi:unnamed protein product [Parnassius apollo]|uniref:(apollo) hypothetical protein n=1 Tax=Parnassius apollo TaxID=110799 RepID=A0A8S3WMU7_PARAO|nr:unnamed protein product [Parnassius apollo]
MTLNFIITEFIISKYQNSASNMASNRIENAHIEELNKLLLNSGVTCVRSTLESEESSLLTEETEKDVQIKEEEEVLVEVEIEEETTHITEETEEEMPEIFPTPSLRKVLPAKIRDIKRQNQIHVLPEEFKKNIDAQRIPKIASTPAQKYIDELAELTGCSCYKISLSEFWFLDTLANLLRRAQEDQMDKRMRNKITCILYHRIDEYKHD